MKKLILLLLLLLIFLCWAIQKSGTIEWVEHKRFSDVPGGEKTSVEYRFRWDRLERYLRNLIPR